MLSIDDVTEEPWGDVAVWRGDLPARPRHGWMETAFAALTVAAGAIGAVGALRLAESRQRIIVRETRRGQWA
ncbi:MAG: hypothetical protein ACREKM_07385 [Longimicrobiales bacterium]